MRRIASTLGVFLVSAMVSFTAVVAFAWPVDTWADDDPSAQLVPVNATKVGSLLASSRLVQDEHTKSKWYVEVSVRNSTRERPESAEIEACVEKQVFNPMARGPSPASIVWRDRQVITVPAGETIVVRRALPAALAAQVGKARAPAAGARNAPSAVTSYSTVVRRPGAEQG